MKRDAVYARYSSHAQDDSTSIEVQVEACERAAGGKLTQYIDRAKTGRATAGRVELLRMLADAEAGKLARVFVYKFDRLGRDAETHVIARQLEDAGVELVSATEGTNALARGIQLVVAEDYSRQLAQRTRDGLLKRFEQGAFTGGVAPYGYRVVDDAGRRVLAVDPAEAEIVREVAHWYLCEAVGFKSIAKRLRARQVPSRRGKGWSFTSVRSLLVNPILTGLTRYNVRKMQLNRTTGRRVPRAKGEAEHLERQDESLRILSDETFAQIQQRIGAARRGEKPQLTHGAAPFSGLVFCQCGARCYRTKSQNAKGTTYAYVCSRHLRYEDCPTRGRVREDKLVEVVNGRMGRVFEREDEIIAIALEAAGRASQGSREDAARIKGMLADVDAEQTRSRELLADRALPDAAKAAIGRQMADAEQRRTDLLAALDGLRDDANDNLEGLAAIVREVFAAARENLAAVKGMTPTEYNRFIERFVGPMVAAPDGSVAQKEAPCNGVSQLQGVIAGGGFEPPTSGL